MYLSQFLVNTNLSIFVGVIKWHVETCRNCMDVLPRTGMMIQSLKSVDPLGGVLRLREYSTVLFSASDCHDVHAQVDESRHLSWRRRLSLGRRRLPLKQPRLAISYQHR